MNMQNNISEIDEFNRINGTDLPEKPLYKLKCRQFETDMTDYIVTPTEFKKSIFPAPMKKKASNSSLYPEKTDEEKRAENLKRSIIRARQKTQINVRQLGANHLLTLTTRDVLTDSEFDQAFTKFARLVRTKKFINGKLTAVKKKNKWLYHGVPELQERGAWHIHIAVVGKQDLNFLRACWYVALGGNPDDKGKDTKGQIDVQTRKKRFSGASKIFKTMQLVKYLTKYIAKSFERDETLGKARYKASRDIKKPVEWRQYLSQTMYDGKDAFVNMMKEVIDIAKSQGVNDFEIFNVGTDVFVLRGMFDKNSLFR